MKQLFLCAFLLALMLVHPSGHAQTYPCAGSGAGPGEVVVGQTQAGNGVASFLLCQSQDDAQGAAAQPQPQWSTRWGAIVTDEPHGIVGSSAGTASEALAERTAMIDCKAKGGVNCTKQISFSNSCAALLVGDKTFNVNSGETEAIASQKAMAVCTANDTGCQVYFKICSLPARIQ